MEALMWRTAMDEPPNRRSAGAGANPEVRPGLRKEVASVGSRAVMCFWSRRPATNWSNSQPDRSPSRSARRRYATACGDTAYWLA